MGFEGWEDQCEREEAALVPRRLHLHHALGRPHRRHLGASISLFRYVSTVHQGSVVVFSNYAWWSYTDTTSPTYCAHTPMLFAFVLLLVSCQSKYLDMFPMKLFILAAKNL